jgi:hypothetical protein
MGDDATGVLRMFQWSGHKYGTGKLKASSLRCYNLLVTGSPIVRITEVFERTPTVFIVEHDGDFVLRPES